MADQKPRLLFYFLHLLGVGHVYRARRLIEAFATDNIAVDVIYGGMPIEGLSFAADTIHHLPPIRAEDATYKRMLDASGNELSYAYLENRKRVLLEIFADLNPDAILTEAFPFGRRIVRHELDALIGAAEQRIDPPVIVSSVRDILQEKRKPGRNREACEWVQNRFDHVLVHADPGIIQLNATFPLASKIEQKLAYTGFVVPAPEKHSAIEGFDVIVSVGGGGFGESLMRTAFQLANNDEDRSWCFATGPNLGEADATFLRQNAKPNVTIVQRLDSLAEHLKVAQISISQCGYNTAMDTLSAHQASSCRAVFIPYDISGQTEQLRRAQLLEKAGYATCLPQSELTATGLEAAVIQASSLPRVERKIDFNGAENSARLLKKWIANRA